MASARSATARRQRGGMDEPRRERAETVAAGCHRRRSPACKFRAVARGPRFHLVPGFLHDGFTLARGEKPSMAKPVVVSIPHSLGREEAARRLKSGLERARTTFGSQFAVLQDTWTGDHLDLRVAILGQATGGTIDVADDHVRIEIELPWLLGMVADKAKLLIEKQGQLMLEKK